MEAKIPKHKNQMTMNSYFMATTVNKYIEISCQLQPLIGSIENISSAAVAQRIQTSTAVLY